MDRTQTAPAVREVVNARFVMGAGRLTITADRRRVFRCPTTIQDGTNNIASIRARIASWADPSAYFTEGHVAGVLRNAIKAYAIASGAIRILSVAGRNRNIHNRVSASRDRYSGK